MHYRAVLDVKLGVKFKPTIRILQGVWQNLQSCERGLDCRLKLLKAVNEMLKNGD